MLTTDCVTARHAVDVERRHARKVCYNARGVVGLRCNLNLRHHRKTHCSGFASMSRIPKSALELNVVCFTMVNNCCGVLEVVSGRAHNPEVGGSNPSSATNMQCCENATHGKYLWLTHNHK